MHRCLLRALLTIAQFGVLVILGHSASRSKGHAHRRRIQLPIPAGRKTSLGRPQRTQTFQVRISQRAKRYRKFSCAARSRNAFIRRISKPDTRVTAGLVRIRALSEQLIKRPLPWYVNEQCSLATTRGCVFFQDLLALLTTCRVLYQHIALSSYATVSSQSRPERQFSARVVF